MTKRLLATSLVLTLAGCQMPKAGPPMPLPSPPARPVAAGIVHEGGVVFAQSGIRGRLLAPANVIAPGGGNVVAPGGLNFRVLAATERPLAGVEVVLTDTAGQAVAGVASVRTDAAGAFAFAHVPAGRTFVVAVRVSTSAGKPATLRSLARPSGTGATVEVSAASSLVTARALAVPRPEQADFNPASYQGAVDAADQALSDATLPDWSDEADVDQTLDDLAKAAQDVQAALGTMRQDEADLATLDTDLGAALERARALGQAPEDATGAAPLVALYDTDANGVLSFVEVSHMLADAQQGTPEANRTTPDELFALLDREEDGTISADDLATFLDLAVPEAAASPAPEASPVPEASPAPEASTVPEAPTSPEPSAP